MFIDRSIQIRPFSVSEAYAAGITRKVLRGPRYRRVHRGIYIATNLELTFERKCMAALLAGPADGIISHISAARLWGIKVPTRATIHVSTRKPLRTEQKGIVLHRRLAPVSRRELEGTPVTGPLRTFVDCAMLSRQISFVWLATIAECDGT